MGAGVWGANHPGGQRGAAFYYAGVGGAFIDRFVILGSRGESYLGLALNGESGGRSGACLDCRLTLCGRTLGQLLG